MFLTRYVFLQIVSNMGEHKCRVPDTIYANVIKFMRVTSNSTQNRQKTRNARKDQKLVSQKIENADLYKPLLNKIMTKHE